MGLFQQRPEEPTEWAGLPAEPWRPRTEAELLGAASFGDPAAVTGAPETVIEIPVSVSAVESGDAD